MERSTLLFILEWLNNGKNAKRACFKLHPSVTERSAEVLGSRLLRKVNISRFLVEVVDDEEGKWVLVD